MDTVLQTGTHELPGIFHQSQMKQFLTLKKEDGLIKSFVVF